MKKIIHRIFFNFDNGGDPFLSYLETWKRELPDFTIMEWNAKNLPLDLNAYTRTLAKEKNHAFLSDYFRCWLLKEHGGVYLDADIEVLDGAPFRDIYEQAQTSDAHDLFIGVESAKSGILTPHSMGVKCGSTHPVLDFLMNLYETSLSGPLHHFIKRLPIPDLMRLYFIESGVFAPSDVARQGVFQSVTSPLVVDRIKIYPQDCFSPLTTRNRQKVITGFSVNTCICHHFAATWKESASGEKTAKTLEAALVDGDYLVAPECKDAVLSRYQSLKRKRLARPQWKLQDGQIRVLERIFNVLVPYQSARFRLFSGKKR